MSRPSRFCRLEIEVSNADADRLEMIAKIEGTIPSAVVNRLIQRLIREYQSHE